MQAKQIFIIKINYLYVVNALTLRHQPSLSRENLQDQEFRFRQIVFYLAHYNKKKLKSNKIDFFNA